MLNLYDGPTRCRTNVKDLIQVKTGIIQGGLLKSSPENVVEKRNIFLLFKLTAALFK